MTVEVTTDAADVRRRLRGLAAQLLDFRPLWPKVRKVWMRHMGEQFSSAGAWGGAAWAPTKRSSGKGILVDTGYMRSHFIGPRGPEADVKPRSLTLRVRDVGTVDGKPRPRGVAIYHQAGTSRMPARPIIPAVYPAQGLDEYRDTAREFADEIVDRWGFGGS